jgi:hypothetical protein
VDGGGGERTTRRLAEVRGRRGGPTHRAGGRGSSAFMYSSFSALSVRLTTVELARAGEDAAGTARHAGAAAAAAAAARGATTPGSRHIPPPAVAPQVVGDEEAIAMPRGRGTQARSRDRPRPSAVPG